MLRVHQTALEDRQPLRTLGRGQSLELVEKFRLFVQTTLERFVDGRRRTGKPALEDGASKGSARPALAGLLGHELVDIGRDRLVEVVFLARDLERHGDRVAIREEPAALQILQVFLEPAQCPGAVGTKAEDVLVNVGRLGAETVRLREEIGVEEPEEMSESILVSMMGSCGQENHMIDLRRQPRCQVVTLGRVHLRLAALTSRGRVGRALVGLVDDQKVPLLLSDPIAYVILLGVVDRGDDLVGALPWVDQLLLVNGSIYYPGKEVPHAAAY